MDYKNVPNKYRPIPFWSWNEKLIPEETAEQIEKMSEQGIGGFFMHARGGLQTPYMGEDWFENVAVSIEKSKQKGMCAWAYDENGWPSGFGDGKVNGKGIEYQQKYLRFEKGEKQTARTIANVDGYHFYYDVNPFYVDTLNEVVVRDFINNIYQPYYERFGEEFEGFFTDEPQISRKGIPWSFIIPEQYEKSYGESIYNKLPELFLDRGTYKETRVKFWKLVTELFSRNFFKQIYDWCTEHNLKLTGHLALEESLYDQIVANGACMPHYEYFTMPGMDWLGKHNDRSLTPYQVVSVAKQLGKEQVLSETFAMCGHNIGHDELKWIYEFQMVRGINLLCQHLEGYSLRGLRKRDYPPAMYIQQPWWKDYKIFNDAMSRIGMILSEGDDKVDTLVIHPQTTAWSMYNDSKYYNNLSDPSTDNIIKLNEDFLRVLLTLEKKHINFHLGDEIIMERHAKVDGNKFVIGKKSYSKVILPECDILFPNTEKLLSEFKKCGGIITTADEIDENDIIDIPEITYCERHYEDKIVYYFVNSTEETYDAYIKHGNKVLNPVNGELSDFDGKHVFHKYESLMVIDDFSTRKTKQVQTECVPIELDGEWTVTKTSENILTLDYCNYYFDGEKIEDNGYILNAMYRAIELGKKLNIKCEFKFKTEYISEQMYLVCETPEKFDISVNGKTIDKSDCGYFFDKSFRKIDISSFVKLGENIITLSSDFIQSEEVYKNLENAKQFEAEKNKLTFDTEIEQIYIVGDFSVKSIGDFDELENNACRFSGEFLLSAPKKNITLSNIERQGFPFFAGDITVRRTFNATESKMVLDFKKTGINVVKAKINGDLISEFMWEPYIADVSEFIHDGENEIELVLTNNLRNMQGPFHLQKGESNSVGPRTFYKEKCIWTPLDIEWNDNYCFACINLVNRE